MTVVSTPPSPVAARPTPTAEPTPRSYVVRAGDTLNRIAFRFGLTREELLAWNPELVDPDRIKIGDRLLIPRPGAIPPVPTAAPGSSLPPLAGWRTWSSEEALFSIRLPPRWVAVTWEVANDPGALASLERRYRRLQQTIEDWATLVRRNESPQIVAGLVGGDPDASPRYELRVELRLSALEEGIGFEQYVAQEAAASSELVRGGSGTAEPVTLPAGRGAVVTAVPTNPPTEGAIGGAISYYVPAGGDLYLVRFFAFGGAPDRRITDAVAGTLRPTPAAPLPSP